MTPLEYHERTKHHFHRFARSAGYLDWATQPDPFRRFDGAPLVALPREPVAVDVPYHALFDGTAPALPVTVSTVSEFLRCALGLSAWKQYQSSRWALRVNPSSGNLHPTEGYVVWGGRVLHYAPREHALEERGILSNAPPSSVLPAPDNASFLAALTSIHWREAWKYGERAFRYCQHDVGHALAAVRFSAARLGWQVRLLDDWSDADIATLLGLDRDADFGEAERESPECLLQVTTNGGDLQADPRSAGDLLAAARAGRWQGTANRLSPRHVEWPVIDAVAAATRRGGDAAVVRRGPAPDRRLIERPPDRGPAATTTGASARSIILRRRSAVAFNPAGRLDGATFLLMLDRLSGSRSPWDICEASPLVHLALFVHRVDGLPPGLYAFTRAPVVRDAWRAAMRPEFLWETRHTTAGDADLSLLLPHDMEWPATRVSCDQDIAGQGFFSLAMLAPTGRLRQDAGWLYRQLFWEAGMIGQVLYLEAEAAGARGTGIGCFYDDAVHELLGLPLDAASAEWQSLYHFSMGLPVEDERLATSMGYEWE